MAIADPFIARFSARFRVYYEDTDLAGIVYHANYLKFFERARTDYLRENGIDQTVMAGGSGDGEGLFFAVRRMDVDFIRPARFDDVVTVECMPQSVGGARAVMDQRIVRGDTVLATARVTVACVTPSGRPARMPPSMHAMMASIASDNG